MIKPFSTHLKQRIRGFWITLPASILFFAMCQDPYFNTQLDASENIPVFNGVLTNIDNLNTFELYYAMPYTNQRINRITGAAITIEDQQNTIIQLDEVSEGNYKLPVDYSNFELGKTYCATISLPNGDILKSENILFQDTLPIANVFFDFNTKTSVVKNSAGEYINVTEEGILVQFRLKKTENVSYYRANANYYVHSEKWVNQTKPYIVHEPHYDIVYEINYDTLYDIYEGFSNTSFPIIGELQPFIEYSQTDLTLNPLFLPADRECRNFSKYTSNTFIEWVIPVDLYHTSREVYDYYTNAAKQLEASGQIFDPIPDQIVGNIHSETNPNNIVLGLFDVSSVNRSYLRVYVLEALGYRSYQSELLSDTIVKQGWYPRQFYIDTVFVDSLPVVLKK